MYQPKVVKNQYPSGVAKLKKFGNGLGLIFSSRKYPDGKFVNGDYAGKSYQITEWPDYVNPDKVDGQVVYAKLDKNGTKLMSVSPQDGVVEMVFTGFGAKEDQEPTPSAPKTDSWGNPYTTATAIFEITAGDEWMIGMPQFMTIRPNLFINDGEGNLTIQGLGNSKAVHGPKMNEFLTNCGGWNAGPVKVVDNPLPEFQKRMLRERVPVKVSIQNGFVQSFWDTVEEDEFVEFESVTEVYSEEPVVTETELPWNDEEEF